MAQGKTEPGPAAARAQAAAILLTAAWIALVTGLAEVALRTALKLALDKWISNDAAFVWTTPVGEAMVLLPLATLLALLALWRPGLASLRRAAFVLSFPALLSLLLVYPKLHPVAMLLLAAGLAAVTSRRVAARPWEFLALVRRTTPWLVALVLALAIGVHGAGWLAERRRLADLPPDTPSAPNVLLIVLDTVRAPSLSLYGYPLPTAPRLGQLATTGVLFERALSPAPWTLPAHASFFTGRWPHELTADWLTRLDDTYPTLAEALGRRGYRTAGFVANVGYASYESGLERGFHHYEDFMTSPGQILISSALAQRAFDYRGKSNCLHRLVRGDGLPLGRKTAAQVNRDFLRWLDRGDERPFFAFLNYMEAHEPYVPIPPFDERFDTKRPSWAASCLGIGRSRNRQQREQRAYDAAIAHLDDQVGRLFDGLRDRGLLDHTLVIVTADHGELIGEHAMYGHGNSLYMPLLHVPLLISQPDRVPAGERVAPFVSLRDLPATVVHLLGLEGMPFPGRSLARYWEGSPGPSTEKETPVLSEVSKGVRVPASYPVARGDMESLVLDGLHYIRNGDGREEVYDVEADPVETRDVAGSPRARAVLRRFRAQLGEALHPGSGIDREASPGRRSPLADRGSP